MTMVSDRCVCLRKFEHSETSQILTLFSPRHGIVRLMAKGAHRRTKAGSSRFDGGVDLLEIGDAVFSDDKARELGLLTEWKLSDGRLQIRKTLRSIYLGLYAAELAERLFEEHDPHPLVFNELDSFLGEAATDRAEEAFLAFQITVLREAGYMPEVACCVSCGSSSLSRDAVYFSPAQGGLICRSCETHFPDRQGIDVRLVRLLNGLISLTTKPSSSRRLPHVTRYQTDPINLMLSEHVHHIIGRPLRMPRYVLRSRPLAGLSTIQPAMPVPS